MPDGIDGAVPPALRTLFDRVADHFPGHTMQRVRLPDRRIRYTYASPGMRETFGIDPARVLAEDIASHDWLHEDDRARFLAALHRSADMLETLDVEVRVRGADGALRWLRSIGHPRPLADGSVVWDGIAIDVTARRETEAAMERMVQLARDAERAGADPAAGAVRFGRALAEIGRHLDALSRCVPPDAAAHVDAVRAGLSALLGPPEPAPASPAAPALTPRQRAVLSLLAEGARNRDIGQKLGIDAGTVKLHVAAILRRLSVANRTAAAAAARRLGLS